MQGLADEGRLCRVDEFERETSVSDGGGVICENWEMRGGREKAA